MEFPAIVNDLSELPEESEIGVWMNNNLPVMEQQLELVGSLLKKPVDDGRFNAAIEAIHFMIDKVALMVTRLNRGSLIFRSRPNYDKLFSEKQEISYNINYPDLINAGRFNRPIEPLFYGSLPVENPDVDPILQCALESCKDLESPENPPSLQDITIGGWVTQGLLPVINLCFDEKLLLGNPGLKRAVEGYKKEMEKLYSPAATEFLYKFMEFFSKLAWSVKENENSYYILNAFFYAVRYYYANTRNTAIPGIIFPSAMTDGLGLNIVLVPQAVDHFLELKKVYMQRFFLAKGTKKYVSYPCSDIANVINGRFQFTNLRPYLKNGQLFSYNIINF